MSLKPVKVSGNSNLQNARTHSFIQPTWNYFESISIS